jgi:hypothetical protein
MRWRRVTVVPEDRSDIKVEVIAPNAKLPISVRSFGDKTIAAWARSPHPQLQRHRASGAGIRVRGVGAGDLGRDAAGGDPHAAGGRGFSPTAPCRAAVGRSASLDLHDSGCSAWTVADVAGDARIHVLARARCAWASRLASTCS